MLWLPTWRNSALLPVISQTPLMLAAAATSARPLLSSTRPLLLMLPAVMAASPSSSVAPAGHADLAAGLAAQAAVAGQAEGAGVDLHAAGVVEAVAGQGGAQAVAHIGAGVVDLAAVVADLLGAGGGCGAGVGEGGAGGDVELADPVGVVGRIAGIGLADLDAAVAGSPAGVAVEVEHLAVAQGGHVGASKAGAAADVERAVRCCHRGPARRPRSWRCRC